MSSTIHFFNEEIEFTLENSINIRQWLTDAILKEACTPGDLNYIFSSDKYLLKINNDYLNHNYYTDIVTFDNREGNLINGDIFISIDRVRENSKTLSLSFQDELHRVIIHGVLHILGYKDKTPEEETLMRSKEDFYLSLRSF